MEKDPPIGMAAEFESLNVLINDNNNVNVNDNDIVTDKWFVNKPFIKGYNIVKNPDYENSNLEKDGYTKCLDCVEWFMRCWKKKVIWKNFSKKEIEFDSNPIPKNYDQTTCRLCEKEFKLKDV